jgi:hypothetical protein
VKETLRADLFTGLEASTSMLLEELQSNMSVEGSGKEESTLHTFDNRVLQSGETYFGGLSFLFMMASMVFLRLGPVKGGYPGMS